jgi:hypothetical protein
MKAALFAVGCMPLFGCPVIETTQPSLTTLTGMIQRPPRRVQKKRKRGGATGDCIIHLEL